MMMGRTTITINPKGQVVHLRTKQPVEPRLLGRQGRDGRRGRRSPQGPGPWMTAPDNPYFARATANWVWAQLFGKGLVDPPDDMSRANPPVHPDCSTPWRATSSPSKFDLRDLVRTIAISEAYGLSSATVPGNERDTRLFSHQLPRPLTAHQMADALAQATDVPNRFRRRCGRPAWPSRSPTRGRPARSSTRSAAARAPPLRRQPRRRLSLGQALLLIGGDVDRKQGLAA